jgi:5-aminopentanamidase
MSSKNSLKIATAQFDAIAGNFGYNIKVMVALLEEAAEQNVRIVVFPELAISGYDSFLIEDGRCSVNEKGEGLVYFINACRRLHIYAVVGACIQRPEGISNSAFVIDESGKIMGTYDKHYLDSSERELFIPGERGFLFEVDGWKFALGICYDSSFPEHARAMALAGAEAYLVLGAFINGGSDHRRSIYLPARALENTIYVVLSNFVGSHGEMDFCGRSAVYAPDGSIVIDGGSEKTGVSIAVLEESELIKNRNSLEMLQDINTVPSLNEG